MNARNARSANRRLSDDDVQQTKAMFTAGVLRVVIAEQFNVPMCALSRI